MRPVFAEQKQIQAEKSMNIYQIRALDKESAVKNEPKIPDTSPYTISAIRQKIPDSAAGKIYLKSMRGDASVAKFMVDKGYDLYRKKQGADPKMIVLENGVFDMDDVVKILKDKSLVFKKHDEYYLRRPLIIGSNATLIIGDTASSQDNQKRISLKLSTQDGAFISNSGTIFGVNADIYGWDMAKEARDIFVDKNNFRPFFVAWSRSKSYFGGVHFYDMGYAQSKAYGFSLTSSTAEEENFIIKRPTGWIVQCRFEGMYYGFYSYRADDIVIVRNHYINNIVYGIDPHDYSRRLIIDHNDVSGTHKKHGIIISRGVVDSWITHNHSYDNAGSGIMLDRSSTGNLVAYNISNMNQGDGLSLFESEKNFINNNTLISNGKNGLRIRNSWDIFARDNIILNNAGNGLKLQSRDITIDKTRDFKEDPFTQKASLEIKGGVISANSDGNLKIDQIDFLRMQQVDFLYSNQFFTQDQRALNQLMIDKFSGTPYALEVVPHHP